MPPEKKSATPSQLKKFHAAAEEFRKDLENQPNPRRDRWPYDVRLFGQRDFIASNPELIDTIIALEPGVTACRGKGCQQIKGYYPRFINHLFYDIFYSLDFDNLATPQNKASVLGMQKIHHFARDQVSTKPATAEYLAFAKSHYWEILDQSIGHFEHDDILPAAKSVFLNPKTLRKERSDAFNFLITSYHYDDKADPELKKIIEATRKNPPDRDTLFTILNAEVEDGTLSEMAALMELEDWDEAQGDYDDDCEEDH